MPDSAGDLDPATPSARPDGAVTDTVRRARAAFDRGETRPLEWRHRMLAGLLRVLQDGEDELVRALQDDLGKPATEGWATDIGTTRGEIRHLDKNLERWAAPRSVRLPLTSRPGRGYVQPEPLGTALVIAPWNYPIQLLIGPMAAAIGAGNAVVAKPSELAPATSDTMARLIARHLDTEAVAVVEGGADTATALLGERFDHLFFTGSTRIGRVVMEAAARHLTPVTLELGGKSPAIVDRSADIAVAGRRIAWGRFLNAGQTCIAPDYVLVDATVHDQFVDSLVSAIHEFYGDDPRASASYGRIVNDHHLSRLEQLLHHPGAGRVVTGGVIDRADRYLAPTVLEAPDPKAPIMQEEIFGPLLPVISVESTSAAVAFVRERPKPLALYVFADDPGVADDVIHNTSAGGTCVNHTLLHISVPGLPFGGVGPSGMGRYHGQAGFDTFSNLRSVLHRRSRPDPRVLYPPYTRLKERLVRRAL